MCLSINFQIVHIEHGVCEARQKNQVSIDTADYIKKNFFKNIYKQTDMPIHPLLEILY